MRGKLISLLMVLAMVLSTLAPVHASTVNQEVELIAQNVKAITFEAANKYGVDILFTVPDEAPTETKVTLYNAADNSVVSGLATGTSISSTVTNPVTYTEGDYVTAGKRVLVCYYGLSNTATYYATIEMKNTSKSGKVTVSDIKPTGYAADWDGFKFGRLYVEHKRWDASHDLVTTSIDTENVYSGESSLKIHSEGFHRNGLNTRDDMKTAVAVNGVNFTSSYYEWKLAYKGKAPKSYECTNGTIKSTTTELDGDWTIVTMVIALNASNTSIYPRIYFGNTFDATTYLDAMSLKKIDTYNDDGTYTITDNTNYLLGGGFETKVSNLRMDTEKVLTWSLEDGAYFAKLTIAKDGEVIDTIDGTTNYRGVQANSYIIGDKYWDIDSTYTVTATTGSGGAHTGSSTKEGKEGEVVSVKGLSDIVAQNVKAITFKAANQYGVDILFTVPDEAPTETKVTLYNAADNSVVSGLATGTSISSTVTNPVTYTEGDYVTAGKRVLVCYYGLSNTATYYATIEMKNASKSGKVTVSDIKPTGYAADWDGFKFGRLYVEHRTWDASHDLVTTSIDTENVYSGESSLKIHSEGFHRNGLNTRDDMKTAVAVNGVNFTSSYYEWKLAYKGKAPKSYECTNGTIKSTTTELDGDWTIVTMVIALNASNTSIYPKIYFGNTFDTTTYLDAMSLKKIDTYNDDGTYTITDNTNYLLGGGFETKVSNLRMDTEKVLTWSLEDGAYFAKLTIAKDGEVIDTIDGTTNYRGVQANSYIIGDKYWDINSTYTVTATTGSGGAHTGSSTKEGKEGAGVIVIGLSDIFMADECYAETFSEAKTYVDLQADIYYDGETINNAIVAKSGNDLISLFGISNSYLVIGNSITYTDVPAGWYNVRVKLNYIDKNAVITVTKPNGESLERADLRYLYSTSSINAIYVNTTSDKYRSISVNTQYVAPEVSNGEVEVAVSGVTKDGSEVLGVAQLAKDDSITINLEYSNTTASETDCTVIAAYYGDNKLVAVEEVEDINTYTVLDMTDIDNLTFFVWESLSTLKPMGKKYEISDMKFVEGEISNLVTSFHGDAGTTRGFAWTASTDYADMVIQYAEADGNFKTTYIQQEAAEKTEYDNKLYYKVDISDLTPGKKYCYRIGDTAGTEDTSDDLWSEFYNFTTEPEGIEEFTFIGITDPQSTYWSGGFEYTAKTINTAMNENPETAFMVDLGDMVEDGREESQWGNYFDSISGYAESLPHMAVVGNHETRGDANTAGKNFSLHFNNPKNGADAFGELTADDVSNVCSKGVINNQAETVYSFDYGDVHIAVLNSGTDWSEADLKIILEEQAKWLDSDLASTEKKWKIVMVHQGVYPAKVERKSAKAPLLEVIDKYNVDLVLQGHDHVVARTYPMKNDKVITKLNSDTITKGAGTVYSILGSAGPKRYNTITETPEYFTVLNATAVAQPTYTVFKVDGDSIDVVTKQLNGLIVDQYSIVESE